MTAEDKRTRKRRPPRPRHGTQTADPAAQVREELGGAQVPGNTTTASSLLPSPHGTSHSHSGQDGPPASFSSGVSVPVRARPPLSGSKDDKQTPARGWKE